MYNVQTGGDMSGLRKDRRGFVRGGKATGGDMAGWKKMEQDTRIDVVFDVKTSVFQYF